MSVDETQTVEGQEENTQETQIEEAEANQPAEDNNEIQSESGEETTVEAQEEEVSYSFDNGETPPQDNEEDEFEDDENQSDNFKKLRNAHKEAVKDKKKLLKELEELKKKTQPQEEEIQLGEKPKLSDYDFDEEAHEEALDKWYEDKAKIETQQKQKEAKEAKKQERFQNKVQNYVNNREQYVEKKPDYVEVEKEVEDSLDSVKLEIAMSTLEKPNDFVYTLGKNKAVLDELSSVEVDTTNIHSVIEFAGKIARLEANMKEVRTPKKPATKPEKRVVSTGSLQSSDVTLEKLREEAAKTGNYNKVRAYKKQIKNK